MTYVPKYNPNDLEHVQEMYDRAVDAEKAVLESQEYSIANRNQKRAMLDQVSRNREFWGHKVEMLSGDSTMSPKVQSVVPRN